MYTQRRVRFSAVIIILSLLLGQLVSGSVTAEQADGEAAEYWSFIPVVTRYLGFRESTGMLDPSFGEGGIVLTSLESDYSVLYGLALQPDGKIIAVGTPALLRYHPDGSLDASFSGDGIALFDFDTHFYGSAVALQPDGKILVVGKGSYAFGSDFSLVRYHADGSVDTSFGTGGQVITDFGGVNETADAIVLQPDGKIIVGGSSDHGDPYLSPDSDFALARYHPDGSLDSSFGSGGLVTLDFYDDYDYGFALARQPDGKILIAGSAGNCPYFCFALARYNPDGSQDTTFGAGGWVTADMGLEHDFGRSMALQADGKIVLAGEAVTEQDHDQNFALVRYHPDGVLDLGFGIDGKVITYWGCDSAIGSIAVQPNGKIVAAGSIGCGSSPIALARYNLDGSLDESFGYLGLVMTELDDYSYCYTVAVQADGKVVAAGFAGNDADYHSNFALVRYK